MFFLRIDDRFIHGQVGVTWISYTGANEILLANDEIVKDSLACTMQKLSAPTAKVTIKSVSDAIKYMQKIGKDKFDKLFVIVSCPQDALRLIDAGFDIKHINIGHTANKDERVEIHPHLFVGRDELEAFQKLEALGVDLDFRLVPNHKKPKIEFKKISI